MLGDQYGAKTVKQIAARPVRLTSVTHARRVVALSILRQTNGNDFLPQKICRVRSPNIDSRCGRRKASLQAWTLQEDRQAGAPNPIANTIHTRMSPFGVTKVQNQNSELRAKR